jgi:hypothetical protein
VCLKYFGIDLPDIFKRGQRDETTIEIDKD